MKVVTSVDVPLDVVAFSFGGKGLEAMRLSDLGTFIVCGLLMFFIVTVIGIDDVTKLADFALEVKGGDLCVVQFGV